MEAELVVSRESDDVFRLLLASPLARGVVARKVRHCRRTESEAAEDAVVELRDVTGDTAAISLQVCRTSTCVRMRT